MQISLSLHTANETILSLSVKIESPKQKYLDLRIRRNGKKRDSAATRQQKSEKMNKWKDGEV